MRKILLLLAMLVPGYGLIAQQTYEFKDGLISGPCHQYGRTALFTDQLAYELCNGQLKTPQNGAPSFADEKGAAQHWQTITAAADGAFTGRQINNGYLYVSYNAPKAQTAILNIAGHQMVYVNGTPHAGDMYRYGWMYIPVQLRQGNNEFYIRTGRSWGRQGIKAKLMFPEKPVYLSIADSTMPFVVKGNSNSNLWGAVVVVNTTTQALKGLSVTAKVNGVNVTTSLPDIAPLTTRKVGFKFDATASAKDGSYNCTLTLEGKQVNDTKTFPLTVVTNKDHYSNTFVSDIDGSVQYYAVSPQANPDGKAPAFFLSVHGAEVQAINQARAYKYKDWGVLVAPTNRRPRGFNWEDWGRLDALEVLNIGVNTFHPDPSRIYLTGHSMGGHGTWYLGATFAGKWAAIAPCSGYPTLMGYGSADGLIPDSPRNSTEQILLRASNPSNVFKLANNYKAGGVYILHGDSDKVVSVDYARQMKKILADFHKDFSYYEYPGGEHWYGDTCVDWGPLYEYFKWHTIPADTSVNEIDFTTANPAISAVHHWVRILQQQHTLEYSRIQLSRNSARNTVTGTTSNIQTLAIDLKDVPVGNTLRIALDGNPAISYTRHAGDSLLYLQHGNQWAIGTAPAATDKGVVRNGTFKEAFNHRMVFVYSTGGTPAENEWSVSKARYDAETWYYRGNGAVDIVADKDFKAANYPDRGIILYGNATTNKAWNQLLQQAPVQITRGKVTVGQQEYAGDNFAAYFMWPRADSKTASVAVVAGTGLAGMRAADANQYFAGGSGFPDYMVFSTDLLKGNMQAVKTAGFYDNKWQLDETERIKN
ncbi:carboxylesterase family protein [Chitinophaga agri]|uniref:Prolyl oligopeptidase family serine peptidase n=1 Tax=Chitinophaga agri TaxID=2703787 RepID=A0A6B9ZC99_9BACT|nr:prolyl oligopeptidase family serine peptidase [Chitinophaga agri]QHS59787.1 prolyl oligopeptidase family serine peptidase [Chitinophaga agri]